MILLEQCQELVRMLEVKPRHQHLQKRHIDFVDLIKIFLYPVQEKRDERPSGPLDKMLEHDAHV